MNSTTENTWMPTVAGILDICAGISAVMGALPVAFVALGMGSFALPTRVVEGYPIGVMAFFFFGLASLMLAAGVVAIVGGIYAIQRSRRMWALAGCIAAVFGFFPLGIPAVILTVLADRQFEDGPSRAAG